MNFRKLYIVLILLISVSLSAFSQSDTISLNTIMQRTAKLAGSHPFEKIHLQFDKPYYAVGDTVWFKAYVTIDNHMPSKLSSIVYVDVITSKDSIAQTLKLQVNGSMAFGNVTLSAPLYKQDNYRFRAYTNWMRNEDPAYFFNKVVPVGAINNPIVTGILFAGTNKPGAPKISAKLIFKDPSGKPIANKKVSWKASNVEEDIDKGKGVTNANGVLDVTFNPKKSAVLTSGTLVADISLTDDKTLTSSFPLTHALDQPDIQFFPEGGDLLVGTRSKVAIKAVKTDGLGIDVKGSVVDNTGATVAEISTQHLGMGIFALQPEAGKTYKANITFPDGTQTSYNLPAVKAEGMSVSVYHTDASDLTVKVTANPAFLQKNQKKIFYIVGQVGQTICWAAQAPLESATYSKVIPISKFPSGVVKFTLLNDHGQPLAERISFIMRDDLLNLTLKTTQATYSPKQKATVNVTAMAAGQPSEANLSVTVVDETKVPYDENSETTILTNLLLTSDLKGYIEKPNYYFNHPTETTAADLDVLMLTQGYRRFSYSEIAANKFPAIKFPPEDKGITITGTLRNGTGLPISRGNLTMVVGDKKSSLHTIANTVGEFKFEKLLFPDSTKLSINAQNNANSNNLLIILDNYPLAPVSPNINAPDAVTNIDSAMNAYIQNAKQQAANSHILAEVTIRDTKIEKKPSHTDYPSLMGLSMDPDYVASGDRFMTCPFIAQCLETSAFGLIYTEEKLFIARTYNAGDKRPVALYYNGMAVDINYLQNIASADVESVEVFRNDGLSGINRMDNSNGVVVINGKPIKHVQMSRADIMAILAPQHSAANTLFKGYSLSRVFYSPKYDPGKSYPTDLRSTIYWNPKVVTDKTGNATFDFFNGDARGSYRAIIEGIDSNGNIGRAIYHYTIQ